MKQLWAIAKKDLAVLLRSRGELVALFLMPLAFILPISLAMPEDAYNLDSDVKRPLSVAVYDDPQAEIEGEDKNATHELLDLLAESFALEQGYSVQQAAELGAACDAAGPACDEQSMRALLAASERNAGLVVPQGFAAAVAAGEPVTLTLLYDPAGDAIQRKLREAVVEGAAMKLSVENQVFGGFDQFEDIALFAPDEVQDAIADQANMQEAQVAAGERAPALAVVEVDPAGYSPVVRPNNYQQTVPGYTVMFAFWLIAYLAGTLTEEKQQGTLRRQLSLPAGRATLLGGKLLAAFLIGMAQVAILFAVGALGFGLDLGGDPLALLLVTAALVLAAMGLGMAAHALGIENALTAPLIVAALLGGCLFPQAWLPPVLRAAGSAVPHTYAMSAYQDLMVRGRGLLDVLPEVGVLLAFGAVAFLLAVRRFSFEP